MAAQHTIARNWAATLKRYRAPSVVRGAFELAITLVPFVLLWASMLLAVSAGRYWLYALMIAPTAGLLVRLFMIQHDCGHGSFFPSRLGNDWAGRADRDRHADS